MKLILVLCSVLIAMPAFAAKYHKKKPKISQMMLGGGSAALSVTEANQPPKTGETKVDAKTDATPQSETEKK